MARAKHRGAGPKPNKNKITIGDGSIRDLAYWLMGGDVSVKRGRKNVSASQTREEIPYALRDARTRLDAKKYDSYYNPLTDYEGKYDAQTLADQRTKERLMAEREMEKRTETIPRDIYGRQVGEFDQPRSRMYDSPMYKGTGTAAGDRRALGPLREPTLQPRPTSPTSPQLNRNVPLMGRVPHRSPRKPLPPMQQIPDEDAWDAGAMSYMGGPVKKRKRKKYMGGGKIKKYAKGGGIRKPKYS